MYTKKKFKEWIINVSRGSTLKPDLEKLAVKSSLSCNENYICCASIMCCICGVNFKIQKSATKKKWILSNFYKHYKSHLKNESEDIPKRKKTKSTVTDYFKSRTSANLEVTVEAEVESVGIVHNVEDMSNNSVSMDITSLPSTSSVCCNTSQQHNEADRGF